MAHTGKRLVFNDEGEQQAAPQPITKKAKYTPNPGRSWTLSIAVPGSIVANAQTLELRTTLAGQVARALAIFEVDEVIVYEEETKKGTDKAFDRLSTPTTDVSQPAHFLARLLQYQECPQYLRKSFFPVHKDLKMAGLLNPLDAPHHMRRDEWGEFREGVVIPKHQKKSTGSYVDAGLYQHVYVPRKIPAGTRVTIQFDSAEKQGKHYHGRVCSPNLPREKNGTYWGYNTRLAKNMNAVLTECPFEEGYDVTIGASFADEADQVDPTQPLAPFRHLLIVFGGIEGLEVSIEADPVLGQRMPASIFNHYIRPLEHCGSRTIRTEEALFVTLSLLHPMLPQNAT